MAGQSPMNRRDFLKTVGAAVPVMALAGRGPQTAHTGKYNVLFIICDDLNDSIAGMGGHPQALTPHIGRLMEKGVRFTNGHCNAPICAPSRASLWTGLYPCTTGYYGFAQQENHWRKFPALEHAVTMMEHFRDNGYSVYGTGKVFHNGHEDNTVFNMTLDGGPASFGPYPWDGESYETWGKPLAAGHPDMPPSLQDEKWEGFGSLDRIPEVGNHTGWMQDWQEPWDFEYRSADDRDPMPDEISAHWVADVLNSSHSQPFFIACGFNRPHIPRYCPQEFYDLFPLEHIELPPYLDNDLDDCAKILWTDPVTGRKTPSAQALDKLLTAGDETPEGGLAWWKKWIQSYLACAAFVDHQVGVILDTLEQSAYADNTIVVLTGDHGYHMGEKDHFHKTTIWEEVTRVPYVVSVPGLTPPGSTCARPVSLIDLYPTLIDLCGLPGHPNASGNGLALDGFSLRPFMENPESGVWDGPDVALNHLHGPDLIAQNTPAPVEKNHHSVRSEQYRYTLCSNGEEELYDHEADPNEWTNLAGDSRFADIKAGLRTKLLAMTGLEPVSVPARSPVSSDPGSFGLRRSAPNPFNDTVLIEFQVQSASPVRIDVLNNRGQCVRTLIERSLQTGTHWTTWDGRNSQNGTMESGEYLVRLRAGTRQDRMKVILLK
ncbi:sulfatase-like hydrolase/transferase [bacterium]|nr:sulfatase-like hydrolase/transferase [bacterium]